MAALSFGCAALAGCGPVKEDPSGPGQSGSGGSTSVAGAGGRSTSEAGTGGVVAGTGGATDPEPNGKACGARAGDTCAADEYCAYVEGELCGAADAESICKPRPSPACPELYAPVCACDQKTYDNSCFANAAGAGIWHFGPCDG
jgi:Kazal-type serine protease inhibitor-like protein